MADEHTPDEPRTETLPTTTVQNAELLILLHLPRAGATAYLTKRNIRSQVGVGAAVLALYVAGGAAYLLTMGLEAFSVAGLLGGLVYAGFLSFMYRRVWRKRLLAFNKMLGSGDEFVLAIEPDTLTLAGMEVVQIPRAEVKSIKRQGAYIVIQLKYSAVRILGIKIRNRRRGPRSEFPLPLAQLTDEQQHQLLNWL